MPENFRVITALAGASWSRVLVPDERGVQQRCHVSPRSTPRTQQVFHVRNDRPVRLVAMAVCRLMVVPIALQQYLSDARFHGGEPFVIYSLAMDTSVKKPLRCDTCRQAGRQAGRQLSVRQAVRQPVIVALLRVGELGN